MTEFGLRVNDGDGGTLLDTTDTISRMRYRQNVAAGVSSSITLPGTAGLNSVEFSVLTDRPSTWAQPIGTIKFQQAHNVTRNGEHLSWVSPAAKTVIGGNFSLYLQQGNSLIYQFLYS